MKIGYTDSPEEKCFALVIDDLDISTNDALILRHLRNKTRASINILIPEISKKILNAKPIDFLSICSDLSIDFLNIKICFLEPDKLSETYPEVKFGSLFLSEIYFSDILTKGDDRKTLIGFNHSLDLWKNSWSIAEYIDEFKFLFKQNNEYSGYFEVLELRDQFLIEVKLIYNCFAPQKTLNEFIYPFLEKLSKIHTEVVQNLSLKLYPDSIVTHFHFPNEIKSACEQYLLYFVRFLQDIGIRATAELKEDTPGNVLFVVTPENQAEALDTIRKALAVYLNIPAQVDVYHPVNLSQEIAIQRLVAQVQHFQSQLTLARAELQLRAATIQQKDKLIHQQQQAIEQQILSQNVLLESMQKDADDAEPVLGDLVSVKKYEGEWVEVNLPSILRYLKRLFNKT